MTKEMHELFNSLPGTDKRTVINMLFIAWKGGMQEQEAIHNGDNCRISFGAVTNELCGFDANFENPYASYLECKENAKAVQDAIEDLEPHQAALKAIGQDPLVELRLAKQSFDAARKDMRAKYPLMIEYIEGE